VVLELATGTWSNRRRRDSEALGDPANGELGPSKEDSGHPLDRVSKGVSKREAGCCGSVRQVRERKVVRKLVVTSAFFKRDGGYPWFWEAMKNARLENMPMELQEAYRKVAPHPENLRSFHDKAAQRMRDFKDIPADAIRAIAAPTLVMIGDADVVRPEHAVELIRLLPHAQLAVLPGTDHMTIMTRTDWLVTMIGGFLDSASVK